MLSKYTYYIDSSAHFDSYGKQSAQAAQKKPRSLTLLGYQWPRDKLLR